MRAVVLLLAVGCLRNLPADGSLRCNHEAARLCPSGFYCEPVTDSCWRNGSAPDGGAVKRLGDPCAPGDACQCVDGYCCDDPCPGQCQACDVVPGTCTNVVGPPHQERPSCSGSGACGAVCDGSSAVACAYPGATTPCGPNCSGGCDSAGSCGPGVGAGCPNGFACGGDRCLSSCSGDGDCQPFFHCVAPSCVRLPESDCLDGIDNNGDGLADCADPSCGNVTCVPDPAGGSVGAFVPSASPSPLCAPDFANPMGLHLTPVFADGCANCACTPSITCSASVLVSDMAACASGNTYSINTSDSAVTCTAIPAQTIDYMETLAPPSVLSATCAGIGSTKPSPAGWGVSQGFCLAARQSNSCPSGQICVPRPSPGAALCLQLPGSAATCPAGWSGGSGVTWYQSFSDNRACLGCSCMPSSTGSCPSWRVSQATLASGSCTTLLDTQVVSNFCAQNLNAPVSLAALALQLYSPTEPTCKVNLGTGTVTPTGGVTICCPSCSCANPPCNTPACSGGSYCDGSACRFCGVPTFCGPACTDCTPLGDGCVSGVCKCGANAECDAHIADNCTGGQCRCGTSQPCFRINSDSCSGGQCRCGAGPACDPATSDSCSGGQCHCGGQLCNDQIANSCTSGVCRCGVNPACSPSQHCINNACQ